MKPYFLSRPTNRHLDCCRPGHDAEEAVSKWVGCYNGNRSVRAKSAAKRVQARLVRRALRLQLRRDVDGAEG